MFGFLLIWIQNIKNTKHTRLHKDNLPCMLVFISNSLDFMLLYVLMNTCFILNHILWVIICWYLELNMLVFDVWKFVQNLRVIVIILFQAITWNLVSIWTKHAISIYKKSLQNFSQCCQKYFQNPRTFDIEFNVISSMRFRIFLKWFSNP